MGTNSISRVWSACVVALLCNAVEPVLLAGDSLFPTPLHLTRKIVDPLASRESVVDEYYEANRVVTVNGDRTVIVDYARQVLTEFDPAGATYSITPFAEIARSTPTDGNHVAHGASGSAADELSIKVVRRLSPTGRPVDSFEISGPEGTGRKVRIDIDRAFTISRAALEVLLGAAYPGSPNAEQRAMIDAARVPGSRRIQSDSASAAGPELYGLPVEHEIAVEWNGTTIRSTTIVIRTGNETAPPASLAVPPGAKRVESRITAIRRGLEELDRPPSTRNR